MKKLLYMAVAAIAALSSCSSDNDIIESSNGNSNKGEAKVFTGIIEGDATTRTTIAAGSETGKKKVEWEATDEVSINGVTYKTTPNAADATKATFAKKNESDEDPEATYKACYPATMASGTGSSVTFSLPATYTYEEGKFNMPMYAKGETTELDFQNICGVFAIKVTSAEMSMVSKITITSDKAISGPCTIELSGEKYAATATGTADANKTVTLDCGTGVAPTAEGTIFYLPLPVISEATLTIEFKGTPGVFVTKKTMKATGVTIARSRIYNVALTPAKFTVAEGKTVNFTSGNLYWDGSAFKFESSQTAYPTTFETNHIGHFFWSKTASVMYANSYSDSEASASDTFFFDYDNRNNEANKVDGISGLYALSGGSDGEWSYLLGKAGSKSKDGRTNASDLYKYGVSVTTSAGTAEECLIIAPDGYDYTAHPLQTSYNADEWAAAEALGLVCLPAAGFRSSSVKNGGTNGYYWSSSRGASGASYLIFGWNSTKSQSTLISSSTSDCKYGRALRLVK